MILWTPETKKQAADLWNAGQSASEIAAQFGCSRNAIIGISTRNRDLFGSKGSGRPADPRYWSESQLRLAQKMWEKGDRACEIGAAVGRSAGAVLKMAKFQRGLFPARAVIKPREKTGFLVVNMLRKAAKPDRPIIMPNRRRDDWFPPKAPDHVGVTVLELTDCLCRFPTWGDYEDFNVKTSHYCGAAKDPSGLYCRFHCDAVRGRGTRSEQYAASVKTRVAA